jgi:hypothetical protein
MIERLPRGQFPVNAVIGREGKREREPADTLLAGGPQPGSGSPFRLIDRAAAKLATRKSDGFVLSGKRTHRLAARTHEARPALVNKWTLNGAGSGSSVGLFGVRAFTTASSSP